MRTMEDITSKVFGKWTVLSRAPNHGENRNSYWLCECDCGEVKELDLRSTINLKAICNTCGRIDLRGKFFGSWEVIRKSDKKSCWVCKCSCGITKDVQQNSLVRGLSTRCQSCSNKHLGKLKMEDLIDKKFGKWTVLSRVRKMWLCKCECGTTMRISVNSLKNGLNNECCKCRKLTTTGLEKGERPIWRDYIRSAINRGLEFNLTKLEFRSIITSKCFYCGESPKEINGIDRVDNSKGYTKDNCVASCTMCNMMKKAYSLDDFFTKIEKIYLHQNVAKGLDTAYGRVQHSGEKTLVFG